MAKRLSPVFTAPHKCTNQIARVQTMAKYVSKSPAKKDRDPGSWELGVLGISIKIQSFVRISAAFREGKTLLRVKCDTLS